MQFGFEQCPYCGNGSGFLYIHGHYQCKVCHQNVMPCCGGEQEVVDNEQYVEDYKPEKEGDSHSVDGCSDQGLNK